MMGKLLWPDNDSVAGKLVRIEAKAEIKLGTTTVRSRS